MTAPAFPLSPIPKLRSYFTLVAKDGDEPMQVPGLKPKSCEAPAASSRAIRRHELSHQHQSEPGNSKTSLQMEDEPHLL